MCPVIETGSVKQTKLNRFLSTLPPEDKNKPSFRNTALLDYQMIVKIQSLSNPLTNTPSSEPFRIDN
jgi:hypothetical protein